MRDSRLAPLAAVLVSLACAGTPSRDDAVRARSHYDLGNSFLGEGNPRAALEEYMKARELDPSFPDLHNALGLVLHNAFQRPDEAIAAYQKAVELNPRYSEAWNNLGTVYLDQQRYDEAITCFDKALSDILYKTPYVAEGNLGWAWHLKGDRGRALEHLEKAVFLDPTFCQGHRNLGIVAFETGDAARAVEAFRAYEQRCPRDAEAPYRLALALMKQGDRDGARNAFSRCRDATRDKPESLFGKECRQTLKLLEE